MVTDDSGPRWASTCASRRVITFSARLYAALSVPLDGLAQIRTLAGHRVGAGVDDLITLSVIAPEATPNDQVFDLCLTVITGQRPWGRGESNPYWLEPKSSASACWATAPVLPAQGSPGGARACRDIWLGGTGSARCWKVQPIGVKVA